LKHMTVWRRVCDHLKQALAAVGPPLTLLSSANTMGNCGF
jgi:hypothetical protein